mgnify:CR=1 FL=1
MKCGSAMFMFENEGSGDFAKYFHGKQIADFSKE